MNNTEVAPHNVDVDGLEAPESPEDRELIEALRCGDEAAFVWVVEQYHTSLLRLACMYVSDHTVAEEVVQETWLGVLKGLGRFEERCSLKSWIFRILTNIARTRGKREHRTIPFSRFGASDTESPEPVVDPDRFGEDGHWAVAPQNSPDDHILAAETQGQISAAVEALPERQKAVITLRDIEGWSADEVCDALEISDVHQRVLLHRARSAVRQVVEQYLSYEAVVA
ncbi:MAG TPA: sigma-70 family RNA polymerase sigma factor [Chloroflexota bacterium]